MEEAGEGERRAPSGCGRRSSGSERSVALREWLRYDGKVGFPLPTERLLMEGRESGLRGGRFGLTVPDMLKEEIAKLSASEKLLLVNDLWDEQADVQEEIPLTDEQKALLDERYRAFLENPDEGEPSEVVRERIAKSL